jgi:hypothetical protein
MELQPERVKQGLVASLNRPGGNVTGVTFLSALVGTKRLGLLHELMPAASTFALLVNPTNPNLERASRDLKLGWSTLQPLPRERREERSAASTATLRLTRSAANAGN